MANIKISLKNMKGQCQTWLMTHSLLVNDLMDFRLSCFFLFGLVAWIVDLSDFVVDVTGVVHEADDAYSIWST